MIKTFWYTVEYRNYFPVPAARKQAGILQSGAMVFILNLDKVSLKKYFPTINIEKVRIFNIENRKYANVRKRACTGLWK